MTHSITAAAERRWLARETDRRGLSRRDRTTLLVDPASAATMPDTQLTALLKAAAVLGYSRLPIRRGVSVLPGETAWRMFAAHGTDEDIATARVAIDARIAGKGAKA